MSHIRNLLLEPPRHSLLRYSLLSAVIAAVGSVLILSAAYAVAQSLGKAPDPATAPAVPTTVIQLFGMAVFAPVAETGLLALTIRALSALLRSKIWIAVFAALVWGGLHSLASPFWFFGTVWSFFVFSCGYLMWRPQSLWHALAAAAIPHALVNTAVFILVALSASA